MKLVYEFDIMIKWPGQATALIYDLITYYDKFLSKFKSYFAIKLYLKIGTSFCLICTFNQKYNQFYGLIHQHLHSQWANGAETTELFKFRGFKDSNFDSKICIPAGYVNAYFS